MNGLSLGIISFGYPPISHVCGTRAHHMATGLAALGHDVTAVTIDWRETPGPAVAREEGVDVVRIDPRAWFPAFSPKGPPFVIDPTIRWTLARKARTFSRVLRWGPYAPWARAALASLLERHRKRAFDVLWAIHGDDSAHETAYRFHRATGVPWVADYKDAWHVFQRPRAVQYAMTARRLATAACLTETAEVQAIEDRASFHKEAHVIWSGYDAELMASATPKRVSDAFSLVQTGHLGPHHDVPAIGRFLALWKQRQPSRRIELHMFGHGSKALDAVLDRFDVRAFHHHHAFVPRAEAFGLLRGADALLLLPSIGWVPSVGVKELECFASGTPVLCLGGLLPEIERVAGALPQAMVARTEEDGVRMLAEEHQAFVEHRTSPRRREVNTPAIARHAWNEKARDLAAVLVEAARGLRVEPARGKPSKIAHALKSMM